MEWPDRMIGRKMSMKRWSQQWTGLEPGKPNKQFLTITLNLHDSIGWTLAVIIHLGSSLAVAWGRN